MNIEPNKSDDVTLLDRQKITDENILNQHNTDEIFEPIKKYIKPSTSSNDSNDSTDSIVSNVPELPKKNKLKCAECNIKLNIINNVECKCGKILCYTHRYHNTHKCNYDYKTIERAKIAELNQKVVCDKVIKI